MYTFAYAKRDRRIAILLLPDKKTARRIVFFPAQLLRSKTSAHICFSDASVE